MSYVRNFVFDEINTLAACPEMPYFDPAKPFVNAWFASLPGRLAQLEAMWLAGKIGERLHHRL